MNNDWCMHALAIAATAICTGGRSGCRNVCVTLSWTGRAYDVAPDFNLWSTFLKRIYNYIASIAFKHQTGLTSYLLRAQVESTARRVTHLLPFKQLVQQALLFHCGCGSGGCIAVTLQAVRSVVPLVGLQGLWAVLQMEVSLSETEPRDTQQQAAQAGRHASPG